MRNKRSPGKNGSTPVFTETDLGTNEITLVFSETDLGTKRDQKQ